VCPAAHPHQPASGLSAVFDLWNYPGTIVVGKYMEMSLDVAIIMRRKQEVLTNAGCFAAG
jgi:hypothetical protein